MSAANSAHSVVEPSLSSKRIAGTIVVIYALITLIPLVWIFLTSIKSPPDSISYPPKIVFTPSLEGYCNLFTTRTRQTPDYIASLPAPVGACDEVTRRRNMQLMADILLAKQPAEIAVVVEERIGIANGENDVELTQPVEPPVVAKSGQEMRRRVEIDAVVVIAVEQVAEGFHPHRQVVAAGKGDELAEEMRMAKEQACRLEGAEAAAMVLAL